ncbi:MAG: putative minor capsid protein [Bacillota bacterium]|nr:putative minor capsid protein [Bacillota bacterium]
MRYVPPIPLYLLPHTATLQDVVLDAWQMEESAGSVELEHVRIEPNSSLKLDASNQQVQLKAVLFFDLVNSRPLGAEFKLGQKVIHDGAIFHVASVDTLIAFGPHHLEVGLI